ncbi:MAG TPA: intradiol ring-cleavage dioxygenase [Burkholderiaceae bacterium]|nr:intradiol ring-cleavage dioxygenase [Burkholderiaceae bacterium]
MDIGQFLVRRRSLPALASAWSALGFGADPVRAETTRRLTPDQILGPFYPVGKAPDMSGDLTRIAGHVRSAMGPVLLLSGQVITTSGEPIAGARIEIWQANAAGRYAHPGDTNPAPLDPDFEGFGVAITDANGRYHFKTVRPAPYPTGPTSTRPAHIHFQVQSKADRLVTQMYFEGDPYNAQDRFLQSVRRPEALTVKLAPVESGANAATFDIIMRA